MHDILLVNDKFKKALYCGTMRNFRQNNKIYFCGVARAMPAAYALRIGLLLIEAC